MFEGILAAIRRVLVRWGLQWTVRRRNAGNLAQNFNWRQVERCLVCWPEYGVDLESAGCILSRLSQRFPQAVIYIIALPGLGASPFDSKAEIIRLKRSDLNWFGWPKRGIREQLASYRVDVAIDLSPEFNPLAAAVCLFSGARLRVAFAGSLADLAFNYQVAPRPGRSRLERYRILSQYIG